VIWDVRPLSEVLTAVLPLVVAMAAGLMPPRHEPDSLFFARQRWRYRDVIIVMSVITVSQFVSLEGLTTVTGMWLWAINNGSTALLIIVSVWSVVRWKHRRPWRTLGFDPTTALYDILWSLRSALGVVSVLAVFVLLMRLGDPDVRNAASATQRAVWQDHLGGFIAVVLVATVLTPIAEELFFRGLAYGPLFRKFGAAGATVGSAILWAAAHYSGLSYASLGKTSVALVLGLVYAEIYRRRESLVPTVVFHVVQNTTAFFIRDPHLVILVPLASVLVGLWLMSVALFHVFNRSRASGTERG